MMGVNLFDKEKCGGKQILFFGLETYSLLGGLQSFNRRLIRHLGLYAKSRGYKPVYAGLLRDRSANIPTLEGVNIELFGSSRMAFLLSAAIKSIFNGDMLMLGNINLVPIAFLTKLFNKKIKVVLFVHGDDVWNDARYRKKKIYDELCLKSVDFIASVSWFTARTMAKEFSQPLSKFRLMPNATDVLSPPRDRSPLGKRILVVSRLDKHDGEKNIDKLIQTMIYVLKYDSEIILEIVGDGVLRPGLESLAAQIGVARSVRFLGRLADEDLKNAYARASVFAMPSSKEGFGIVYLEAWQFGLPVICSKFGASCEIVSDGEDGFVVDPNNVKELSDKIILLIGDQNLAKQFGESGRKKVHEKYSDLQYNLNLKTLISELENS